MSKKRNFPYEMAYDLLLEMAGDFEKYVKADDFGEKCVTVPGFKFPSGVTFPMALENMEHWGWIEINKKKGLVRLLKELSN